MRNSDKNGKGHIANINLVETFTTQPFKEYMIAHMYALTGHVLKTCCSYNMPTYTCLCLHDPIITRHLWHIPHACVCIHMCALQWSHLKTDLETSSKVQKQLWQPIGLQVIKGEQNRYHQPQIQPQVQYSQVTFLHEQRQRELPADVGCIRQRDLIPSSRNRSHKWLLNLRLM